MIGKILFIKSNISIYNTIGNLIFGDEYKNIKNKTEDKDSPGKSLFDEIDQKIRTPKFYNNIGVMADFIFR